MKKWGVVVVAVAVVALTAPAARAQRGGGGGGFGMSPGALLSVKSVQDELKLTEDQITKAKELQDKRRQALQGVAREDRAAKMQELNKEENKALADILKPEQLKRLKQIAWQQRGAGALSDEEVAGSLGLSAEQKEKLKSINEESRNAMREAFQSAGGNREEAQKKVAEIRKSSNDKLMDVLTADQKTKFKELLGEPFKGEIPRPGGRRGAR